MPQPFSRAAFLLILLAVLMPRSAPAQTEPPPAAPPAEVVPSKLESLQSLAESHSALLKLLQQKQAAAGAQPSESAQQEIAELEARKQVLEEDFLALAAGVTQEEYLQKTSAEDPLTLEQELSRLLTPMVAQLRELGKKPRVLQELHEELLRVERRRDMAAAAVDSLQTQLKAASATKSGAQSSLARMLKAQLETWQARQAESQSRILALERQIEDLNQDTTGVWGTLAESGRHFVFTRGRNILLAIAVFLTVFFGLRLLYFYGLKLLPISKMERLSFFSRLLGLLQQGLSTALAVFAALAVLYASGDWLLGGIAILVVIAIALAAKNGLMNYFEQVRMLLNLGSAREGERLLIDGVPWRVGRINLQTRLTNPCIDGPGLRLSLDALMKMTSRPGAKNEAWFPCRSGHMLLLPDDILARVQHISPDFVEITYRGGITRHIPTPEFITMQPANLSEGFLISSRIGLDYRHQQDITQRIPEQLQADVRAGLLQNVPEDQLLDLTVVFVEAASSSLDLLIAAKFSGAAAERYLDLRRLLQRLAVESCNAHGWGIPFPQLVVHQAIAG